MAPRRESDTLRRTSDRIESACTGILVLALIMFAPLAAVQAGRLAYRDVAQANAWESAHRHRVQAVLVETVSRGPDGVPGTSAGTAGAAVARWSTPDGTARRGTVYVSTGWRAGDVVQVWIGDQGQVTGPPSRRDPRTGAGIAAVLAAGAVAAGLAGVRRIVRWQLDRRRMRAWQEEWAVVERVWSRQW